MNTNPHLCRRCSSDNMNLTTHGLVCRHCGFLYAINVDFNKEENVADQRFNCDLKSDPLYLGSDLTSMDSKMEALKKSPGLKYDTGKPPMELLSTIWLNGVAEVLAYGAKKYAPENWRKGMQHLRLLGACLRHVFAYLGGEDNDPETGLCHLHHASCCLMFLSELRVTKPEYDDRYKEGNDDGRGAQEANLR